MSLEALRFGLRKIALACKGRVYAYQIDNECDLSGNPRAYVERFIDGAAAIRAVDPEAKVCMAGIARAHTAWLDATRDAWPHADAVAVHDYGMEPGNAVEVARTWLRLHGRQGLPVWLTEYGVKGTGAAQAASLNVRLESVRRARPDVAALFRMQDEAGGEPFGLLDATGKPKPSWGIYFNHARGSVT